MVFFIILLMKSVNCKKKINKAKTSKEVLEYRNNIDKLLYVDSLFRTNENLKVTDINGFNNIPEKEIWDIYETLKKNTNNKSIYLVFFSFKILNFYYL